MKYGMIVWAIKLIFFFWIKNLEKHDIGRKVHWQIGSLYFSCCQKNKQMVASFFKCKEGTQQKNERGYGQIRTVMLLLWWELSKTNWYKDFVSSTTGWGVHLASSVAHNVFAYTTVMRHLSGCLVLVFPSELVLQVCKIRMRDSWGLVIHVGFNLADQHGTEYHKSVLTAKTQI